MKIRASLIIPLFFMWFAACSGKGGASGTLRVPQDYASLTEALRHVGAGRMTVLISPGTYSPSLTGEVFPLNVATGTTLMGNGAISDVIVDAEGTGGAIAVDSASNVILVGMTIQGGEAENGGGVFLHNAGATVRNNVIRNNHASLGGAGIYVEGTGSVVIENNILDRNAASASAPDSDPHSLRIIDSSPSVINNTIVHGDGNGINISGASQVAIINNILAYNGSPTPKPRGRGICNFSTLEATIAYNSFFANYVADILTPVNGTAENLSAAEADALSLTDAVHDNLSLDPEFVDADGDDFRLQEGSPMVHAGDPDPSYFDKDEMRNTIGHSGGPYGS